MRALGVILAGGNNSRLGALTLASGRSIAAMPIGSGYRTIDFPLSSMTNSGIQKVAVINQFNGASLNDHLSSSKWWDLGRKKGGLFLYSPFNNPSNSAYEAPTYRGTANALYQNLKFFRRSNHEYVVIASGDAVYKMDFNHVINYHKESGNDITMVYKNNHNKDPHKFGVLELDENGRVLHIEEKPVETTSRNISLGIYVINREKLIELLEGAHEEGRNDFVADILVRYRKVLCIGGYHFDGYWETLNSIESYFKTNMDFLQPDIRNYFTKTYPYISTKPGDEPPVKYNSRAQVRGALVSGGSIINGRVENSVLFSNVFVGDNAIIKNSIVMSGAHIGDNCIIENAIIDKYTWCSNSAVLRGEILSTGEMGRPAVLEKYRKI